MKYDILQLNEMLVGELKEIADRIGVADFKKLGKQDLIYRILDAQALNSAPDSKTPEILVEDNTAYEKIPNAKKEDRTEKRPRKRLSVDDKPDRWDRTGSPGQPYLADNRVIAAAGAVRARAPDRPVPVGRTVLRPPPAPAICRASLEPVISRSWSKSRKPGGFEDQWISRPR